jgi:alpha-tubulin suppressor-like RCC1 family protein
MTRQNRKFHRFLRVTTLLAVSVALFLLPLATVSGEGEDPYFPALGAATNAALATGLHHSLVLNYDGRILAFGDNSYGQLGDGTTVSRSVPTELTYPTDVVAISAGSWYSLAVTSDGSVYAWGRNLYGQLGTGDTRNSSMPLLLEGLPPVVAVSAGAHHALALTSDGAVYAWGRNTEFQIGNYESESILDLDGTVLGTRVLTPVLVCPSGAVAVAAGGGFSMYLTRSGTVMAWGDNRSGQLGDGTRISHAKPALVEGVEDVVAISAGSDHGLAIMETELADGSTSRNVYGWGSDSAGQLGQGRIPSSDAYAMHPVRIDLTGDTAPENDQASLIAAGAGVSIIIQPFVDRTGSRKSKVLVLGSNMDGALGLGSVKASPLPRALTAESNGWTGSTFLPFEAVATSGAHTLLLGIKGQLGGMGRNESGQLGDGTVIDQNVPVESLLPDRIAPSWRKGDSLSLVERKDDMISFSWPAAADNIRVAGYETRYIDPDGEEITLDFGEEPGGVLSGFDPTAPQVFRIYSYDDAGNLSDGGLPFEYVPLGMTYEQAFPTGEPEEAYPTGEPTPEEELLPTPTADPAMEADPTTDPLASPEATPTADPLISESPDVTPSLDDGSLDILPGPGWNADEFGTPIPLEVPWDVDGFYGPGVILPPLTLTPAVIAVCVAIGLGLLLPALYLGLRKVGGIRT